VAVWTGEIKVAVPDEVKLDVKITSTGDVKGMRPAASVVSKTVMPVEPPGERFGNPTTGAEMKIGGIATANVADLLTLTPLIVAEAVTNPAPTVLPASSWIVAVPVASVNAIPLAGFKEPSDVVKVTCNPDRGRPLLLRKTAVTVVTPLICRLGVVIWSVSFATAG